MAEQTEKAFLKQTKVFLSSKITGKGKRPGKGGNRFFKNIGLGFKAPKEAINVFEKYTTKVCQDYGNWSTRWTENEKNIVPTDVKVKLNKMLAASGVSVVKATSFVSLARFSDLSELRGLRRLFTRKYRTSMEILSVKRLNPTKEIKMKLLHYIDWNPKALEQHLYVTSQFDHNNVLQPQGVQDKCNLNNEGILHGYIKIQGKEIDEDVTSTDQTEQDRTMTPTSNDSPQKALHVRKSFYERFMTPLYFRREAGIKGNMEHDQDGSM